MTRFRHLYILLLFILSPTLLFCQSAKENLEGLSFENLKENFFNNEKNRVKQLSYANAYLIKAKQENIPVEKARGYILLSMLHEDNKALVYIDSSITLSKNLNDPNYPAYAYSQKGFFYKKQHDYKKAIDNFLIAENIAKKNNPDLYYDTKFSIAVLRSEELGEVKEALNLYKNCLDYYSDKNVRDPKYSYSYQLLLFGLADAYKTLNISDSATYYNKLGYFESKATKNKHINALFILNEGANKVFKGNFKEALDSINKALPLVKYSEDKGNLLAAYYYTAKSYEGLQNKKEAVKNFIKVDSMYIINKRITPEFANGYPYLISYFKKNGDKVNQLKYLTKYMEIDSLLQHNYKELTKKLQKEYDTPYLIQEKENLIQSLKKDKTISYWGILLLILIIIITSGLAIYQYKLKKRFHIRFESIIQNLSEANEVKVTEENKDSEIQKSKTENIGINEEIVKQILKKLLNFEKNKGFLDANVTIQSLSDMMETNNKYLSKIVNVYKEKNFVQYINDLRIEYALKTLKEKNKLRKYTIQALALEFGFNNAESFSSAFNKKTGIKPTFYIRQLEDLKNIQN